MIFQKSSTQYNCDLQVSIEWCETHELEFLSNLVGRDFMSFLSRMVVNVVFLFDDL